MKVAIIGGGAAGMIAAATINELNPGIKVVLVEKNKALGKKVLISGGGRCNVTTGYENIKNVLENYPRGNKFLISALHAFGPKSVFEWFESHGVPLKCEEDMRVFPVSDNGGDVVSVFEKIFKNNDTQILFDSAVEKIEKNGERFLVSIKNSESVMVDKVVLSLGGQAYRFTGSNGDGYSLAENLGHKITSLAPSLHSFVLLEKWAGELSGMSFEKALVSADSEKPNSKKGPFLFTHSGISGPAVFAVSSLSALVPFSKDNPLKIFIDFLPDIKQDILEKQIYDFCQINKKKIFKNTIHHFVPDRLAEVLCNQFGLPKDKHNAEISKKEIADAVRVLKKTTLHAVGRGNGEEFVTAGGVDLSQVDPKTMESKICSGLYFAGEILDIDGFTGGFNLQAAWATGRAAGKAIALN